MNVVWNKDEMHTLYHAIVSRKSVRKYKDEPLSADFLAEVLENLSKIKILYPEESISFKILKDSQVKGGAIHKGASYLAFYAKRGAKSYANVGFTMEQMQLWFSSRGIGSWAHGLTHPIAPWDSAEDLPFAFLLTFGIADGELHRTDVSQFDRKPISELSKVDGIESYLEMMRFAPSGRNRQPWLITGTKENMTFFVEKDNPIISRVAPDLWFIDAGIALCHIWLEASVQDKEPVFVYENEITEPLKKYKYVCSIRV